MGSPNDGEGREADRSVPAAVGRSNKALSTVVDLCKEGLDLQMDPAASKEFATNSAWAGQIVRSCLNLLFIFCVKMTGPSRSKKGCGPSRACCY